MKVQILSDLHVEFGPYDPPDVGADVVILAGDTGIKGRGVTWALDRFKSTPTIYIAGNHEYYSEALPRHTETLRERCRGTNVHFLERESITIDGVLFAGCTLWTDFELYGNSALAQLTAATGMNDFRAIRVSPSYRRLRPQDVVRIHAQSRQWLSEEFIRTRAERIVVVTHYAPSERSIAARFAHDPLAPAFASRLDSMVEQSGASYWIHGHMHDSCDYRMGRTRVICNPRGYYPHDLNANFLGSLVVEV